MLCAAEHLRISPHVWGTRVGLAAALPACPHANHVPFPPLLEYKVGDNPLQHAIFTEHLRYADGYLEVPSGPGFGIVLDPDAPGRFAP